MVTIAKLFNLKKLLKKQKVSFGLDIGYSSIKLLNIQQNPNTKKWDIVNYGYAILDNQIETELGRTLQRLIQDSNIPKGSEVIINLPNDGLCHSLSYDA